MILRGLKLKNIVLTFATIVTLTSCVNRYDDHCFGKIDQTNMEASEIAKVCTVSIDNTTFNEKMVYVDDVSLLEALPQKINEQIMLAAKAIDRLEIVDLNGEVIANDMLRNDELDGNFDENTEINDNNSELSSKNVKKVKAPDYILQSNIDEFIVSTSNIKDPNNNSQEQLSEATVAITYNLISAKNSKVVFSNTINFSYLYRLYDQIKFFDHSTTTHESLINGITNDISSLLSYNLMENLMPIRVININQDKILLNQEVAIGDICYVFGKETPQQTILTKPIDESNYEAENVIAVIEILDSNGTSSLGELLYGETQKYDICRQVMKRISN